MSFLREIFGPSKKEAWTNFADEVGGKFIRGSFFKEDKVEAKAGQWTIVFDTHKVKVGKIYMTYTRVRAPFITTDNFYFKAYREGVFTDLGIRLGMQDIQIGSRDFDSNFVIQSNDEEKVRQLFSKDELRSCLLSEPYMTIEIKNNDGFLGAFFPKDVCQLYFHAAGVVKDLKSLKNLYYLFAETLNQLYSIGSASANTPDVTI